MSNIEKLARYIVQTGHADQIMAALRFVAATSEVEAKAGSKRSQDTRILSGDIAGYIEQAELIKNVS